MTDNIPSIDNDGSKTAATHNNQSALSSAGAIGRQFNPEGSVGQIGQAVGGPFSKNGVVGAQFDASKNGIAGTVEKIVGGPRQS